MPKAHPVALKQLAQALWLQGIRPAQISETTGLNTTTICKWAGRHGWSDQLAQSKQTLSNKLNEHITKDLAIQSIRLKESISDELFKIGTALNNTKTKRNLDHLKKRAQVIESTVSSASKLFGWDAEAGRSPVNVAVLTLQNVPHGTKPVAELEANPVIDVNPTQITNDSTQSDKPAMPEPDANPANHTPERDTNPVFPVSSPSSEQASGRAPTPVSELANTPTNQPIQPAPVPKPKPSAKRRGRPARPKPSQTDSLSGYSAIQVQPTPTP